VTGDRGAAFTASVGELFAAWDLPRATGRVYGLLLITDDPLSLDAIGERLGLSKAAVSPAVRQLNSWGLARSLPQPGSRRLLVEAAGGLESLLEASHVRARALIAALREGEDLAAPGPARERLRDVVDLFTGYVEAGEHLLARRRAR
jgi:DNA-binding MarR family transcriptional regulator